MNGERVAHEADGLLLPGLDGTNPLGFLAAIGLLRVLDAQDPGRMLIRWVPAAGTWVPVLSRTDEAESWTVEELLDRLSESLSTDIVDHPVRILEELRAGPDDAARDRRDLFASRAEDASVDERTDADWLAALASDIVPATANNQLQTTRRDYHFGNLTSVITGTTRDHLRRAIFLPWDYADPLDNSSLHLDPSEDRRHAHQWNKPAGDPDRRHSGGMIGANRLAIEAFAMFTSIPDGDVLRTVGFTGNRSTDTRWTWPIWNVAIPVPVVRSLLVLAEIQQDSIRPREAAKLRAIGVPAVYRTRRILVGKTPNFTPTRRVA